ncbi:hypothetical protein FB639_004514, partial [Coemansia asiatica]
PLATSRQRSPRLYRAQFLNFQRAAPALPRLAPLQCLLLSLLPISRALLAASQSILMVAGTISSLSVSRHAIPWRCLFTTPWMLLWSPSLTNPRRRILWKSMMKSPLEMLKSLMTRNQNQRTLLRALRKRARARFLASVLQNFQSRRIKRASLLLLQLAP